MYSPHTVVPLLHVVVELVIPGDTNRGFATSSQNHRMVVVERDLWGSSSPTRLPKEVPLEQAAQGRTRCEK